MKYRQDKREKVAVKWLNLLLWEWAKERALLEGRGVGKLLNDLVLEYASETVRHGVEYRVSTTYEKDISVVRYIRGFEPSAWMWVKNRAAFEKKAAGELLNALIDRHRRRVESSC